MVKKQHLLAIATYLSIPVVTMVGAGVGSLINPDIAAGHPNYERNYWLLSQLKTLCLLAALAVAGLSWIVTCVLLVRARRQPAGWLALSLLGPFGLIGLTMLPDREPEPGDAHQRFVHGLGPWQRIAYETCVFFGVWVAAFVAMVLLSDLMILWQSARTGLPVAKIIEIRDASSGMYAFSEGLAIFYCVPLLYLLWPVAFNAAARLRTAWRARA